MCRCSVPPILPCEIDFRHSLPQCPSERASYDLSLRAVSHTLNATIGAAMREYGVDTKII